MYCAQNRWTARVYGSAGRMAGAAEDQASSMYWTMTRDSEMGLPWWSRTGDPLVHGVRPEQQLALLAQMQLLLHELVLDALQLQRNQDAGDERARP